MFLVDPTLPEVVALADDLGGYPYTARVARTTATATQVEVTVVVLSIDATVEVIGTRLLWISSEQAQAAQVSAEESLDRAKRQIGRLSEGEVH